MTDEGPEYVGTYADQLRVGIRTGMMTEIEGSGNLAKLQRKRERMDPETRMLESLETTFYMLKQPLQLQDVDLMLMRDALHSCRGKLYKNVFCFVLAYAFLTVKTFSIETLANIASVYQHPDCTDIAIVRYTRLVHPLL